jgi:L-ascorbate metabolism protein UlaG (beta-lactamase superfamily)
MKRVRAAWLLGLALLLLPRLVLAGCAPIAQGGARIWHAATGDDSLTITFLGHASFEIRTPSSVRAITDYNGYNIADEVPDLVTMNHAHSTHYTLNPDRRIRYVLHGWKEHGVVPAYDVVLQDLRVTNLPTNIRDWAGGTEIDGNSIFIFESAGLCIAHLGHLHHLLERQDLDSLGHIDIVMAAIDGAYTISLPDIVTVLDQIQPRVVLPMHYFNREILARFLDLAKARFVIEQRDSARLQVSRASLPIQPTIIALPSGYW